MVDRGTNNSRYPERGIRTICILALSPLLLSLCASQTSAQEKHALHVDVGVLFILEDWLEISGRMPRPIHRRRESTSRS